MRHALDTDVLSALRGRGREPVVAAWAASVPAVDLFVTAMTMAELERGVIAKESGARVCPVHGFPVRPSRGRGIPGGEACHPSAHNHYI